MVVWTLVGLFTAAAIGLIVATLMTIAMVMAEWWARTGREGREWSEALDRLVTISLGKVGWWFVRKSQERTRRKLRELAERGEFR